MSYNESIVSVEERYQYIIDDPSKWCEMRNLGALEWIDIYFECSLSEAFILHFFKDIRSWGVLFDRQQQLSSGFIKKLWIKIKLVMLLEERSDKDIEILEYIINSRLN